MKEVIDTRFLREYLYATQTELKERAHRKLNLLVTQNEGILPTIVVAEITQITCMLRGKEVAQSRCQALIQSGLQIQELTAEIAEQAGLLKCANQNLPMGDCIIAATALLNRAKVLSDDPHFDSIKQIKRAWI